MTKASMLWGIVLVAAVTVAAAGCGSTVVSSGGTIKSITAADMPKLAGTWQGTGIGATGDSTAGTLLMRSDGTYTIQAGPWSAQGKAEVRDGELVFVASGGGAPGRTGGGDAVAAVGQRTGSAVLMDEGGNWALVGSGRSSTGPYNFAFRKAK